MKLFATATTSHGSLSQLYLRASIATGLSELDSSTRVRCSALVNVLNEGEHALGSTNQRRRWCGQI